MGAYSMILEWPVAPYLWIFGQAPKFREVQWNLTVYTGDPLSDSNEGFEGIKTISQRECWKKSL